MTDTLFPGLPVPAPVAKLSPDRRRTQRQAEVLARGQHPLVLALGKHLPLADDAAPVDDVTAPGRRCGNCWFRSAYRRRNGSYPKCWFSTDHAGEFPQEYERITHGPGTDVRGWWPGCRDHSYGDTALSPDAARHVPDSAL